MDVVTSLLGLGYVTPEGNTEESLLEGLGNKVGVQFSPQQKKVAIAAANAISNKRAAKRFITPGREFLLLQNNNKNLPVQTRKEIASGTKRFVETRHYVRTVFVAGHNNELVKVTEKAVVGVRSISDGVLSTTEPVVVSKVKVSYGFTAASGGSLEPADVLFTNAMDAETGGTSPLAVPSQFLNGELEFFNNTSGKKFFDAPVKNFFRDGLSVSGQVEGGFDSVTVGPELFNPNETINVVLKTAKTKADANIALPAGNHFIEIVFFCDTLGNKVAS